VAALGLTPLPARTWKWKWIAAGAGIATLLATAATAVILTRFAKKPLDAGRVS
jgi:hypothetical protein